MVGVKTMQAGDLVRVKRASNGVPKDSVGLIIKKVHSDDNGGRLALPASYDILDVLLHGKVKSRRYLSQDLEVVSESR